MPSQTVTVGSRVGLHARPAALIAEAVGKAGVPVTLATPGGNPIDAGSPLMIMTLGAKQGTEVVVSSEDQAALEQIAGMVPPLAMAMSTAIRPKLYTPAERDNGKAAWLLGASFISEGAIPFAAADPLRVIPSMMLGGATTGAIVAVADIGARAPHGGVFVFFAITNFLVWLLAIVIGAVVGGIAVTVAKSIGRPSGGDEAPEDAVDLAHAHTPASAPARAATA